MPRQVKWNELLMITSLLLEKLTQGEMSARNNTSIPLRPRQD